jgi:hypothetical protein
MPVAYGLVQVRAGTGLGAVPVALNPNVVEAFGASCPLCATFLATTEGGCPVSVAFQGEPAKP